MMPLCAAVSRQLGTPQAPISSAKDVSNHLK